ncbi:hypothetical protein [Streptococcus suis]|uniref:hypothetical protein n=1 Tax=Streptococcus suis TaxID=1307 RepID=UPI0004022B90|nr:hypothetical protein [Streptococcus suis]
MFEMLNNILMIVTTILSFYLSLRNGEAKEKLKSVVEIVTNTLVHSSFILIVLGLIIYYNSHIHFLSLSDFLLNNSMLILSVVSFFISFHSLAIVFKNKKLNEANRIDKYINGKDSKLLKRSSFFLAARAMFIFSFLIISILFSIKNNDEFNDYTLEEIYVKQDETIYLVPSGTYFKTTEQDHKTWNLNKNTNYTPLKQNIYYMIQGTKIILEKGTVIKAGDEYDTNFINGRRDGVLLAKLKTVIGETTHILQKDTEVELYFDLENEKTRDKYKVYLFGDLSTKDRSSNLASPVAIYLVLSVSYFIIYYPFYLYKNWECKKYLVTKVKQNNTINVFIKSGLDKNDGAIQFINYSMMVNNIQVLKVKITKQGEILAYFKVPHQNKKIIVDGQYENYLEYKKRFNKKELPYLICYVNSINN